MTRTLTASWVRRRNATAPRRGSLTIEFALTIPLLFLFVWSMLEFSRAYMIRNAMDQISYEAARVGVSPGANVSDMTATANSMLSIFSIKNGTVSITPSSISDTTTQVSVTVSCKYSDNCWFAPLYLANKVFSSTATLQHENALFASQTN